MSPWRVAGVGAVALLVGAAAGGGAVAFRSALALAEGAHERVVGALMGWEWGWPLAVAIGAGLGAVARALVGLAPETSGSGIPHVEQRLQRDVPMRWPRLLAVKFLGGLAALTPGMSLGREGPLVQMGAALGEALAGVAGGGRALRRALVAAGAGAGLAGAFNAPLAGFAFVLEELRRPLDRRTYVAALPACLMAQVMLSAAYGTAPLLGVLSAPSLSPAALLLAAGCGLLCGVIGVLYNRAVFLALDGFDSWRAVPVWVHGAVAGALAVCLGFVFPEVIFGGDPVAAADIAGTAVRDAGVGGAGVAAELPRWLGPVKYLALLVVVKLLFTAVCYGSGVVGGLFAPQIVIGAGVGALIAQLVGPLLGDDLTGPMAGVGAVAVFTASVRVPLTGVVLLAEMTGTASQVFAYGIGAAAAFVMATALGEPPVYDALRERSERQAAVDGRTGGSAR